MSNTTSATAPKDTAPKEGSTPPPDNIVYVERIGNVDYQLQEHQLDVFNEVTLWNDNPRLIPHLGEAAGVPDEAGLEKNLALTPGYTDSQADIRLRCVAALSKAATGIQPLMSEPPQASGDDAFERHSITTRPRPNARTCGHWFWHSATRCRTWATSCGTVMRPCACPRSRRWKRWHTCAANGFDKQTGWPALSKGAWSLK